LSKPVTERLLSEKSTGTDLTDTKYDKPPLYPAQQQTAQPVQQPPLPTPPTTLAPAQPPIGKGSHRRTISIATTTQPKKVVFIYVSEFFWRLTQIRNRRLMFHQQRKDQMMMISILYLLRPVCIRFHRIFASLGLTLEQHQRGSKLIITTHQQLHLLRILFLHHQRPNEKTSKLLRLFHQRQKTWMLG